MTARNTPKTDDPLLDTEALAALLGGDTTPDTVRKAHQRGHLPPGVTLPGIKGLRWRKSAIEKWLDERFAEGTKGAA